MSLCCGNQVQSLFLPGVSTIIRKEPMTDKDMFFEFMCHNNRDLGHKPGQFLEISLPGFGEAPISISSSPTKSGSFEMVVRRVGRLTTALHQLEPGKSVGIRGPFGTHFPMEELAGKDILFIGGGIGLVPLRSAIKYALDKRSEYGQLTILFGCVNPTQRLFTDELTAWAKRDDLIFMETVDKGDATWPGQTGVLTTLFPRLKAKIDPARTKALVVGPPVMYKFVILELRSLGFKDQDIIVSLERHMKCGVGKCGHCQINHMYVCQDGPVFTLEALRNLTEAL